MIRQGINGRDPLGNGRVIGTLAIEDTSTVVERLPTGEVYALGGIHNQLAIRQNSFTGGKRMSAYVQGRVTDAQCPCPRVPYLPADIEMQVLHGQRQPSLGLFDIPLQLVQSALAKWVRKPLELVQSFLV